MAIDWYFPDWDSLPESARAAAIECAEEYWGISRGGDAVLDIYETIRRELFNPSYQKRLPMKDARDKRPG